MPSGSFARFAVQSPSELESSFLFPNQPSSRTKSSTPRSFAGPRDRKKPVFVEIKVRAFPVIDQNRRVGRGRASVRRARGAFDKARDMRRTAQPSPEPDQRR